MNCQKKRRQRPPPRRLDLLPMLYGQLLQHLLKAPLVEPKPLDPPPRPYPLSDNKNSRCDKVQDLIDDKQLTFEEGIPIRER
ncbi:hypothetical protein A2U01_0052244, partial [Trifolium medium]|nr:hypothetical protein [Trifolium medium]